MSRLVPSLTTMRRYGRVGEFKLFPDFFIERPTTICSIIASWGKLNKERTLVYPIGWFIGAV